MNKDTNEELFRYALNEGLARRFQSEIDKCTEEINCSPRHKAAMEQIINGNEKCKKWRALTPKTRRIIAVLIAAAFILASCAIAYRREIRSFIEKICDSSFIAVTYSDGEGEGDGETERINEIYELTYLPEGYSLENKFTKKSMLKSVFSGASNKIVFEQRVLDLINFYLDVENGYTKIVEIEKYDVYYRITAEHIYYLWNDGKYSMTLISDSELDFDTLQKIIDGIAKK